MKLIDRYIVEVGRRLSLMKGRADIEKELRSTLEDMLEDRARQTGRPVDEAMEMELLKEYGAPDKVAATYNSHPYLIGPQMFPFFMTILKIVIGAVVLGLTIALGVQIAAQAPTSAMDFASVIGKWLLNILSASIGVFGNLALIFALLERFAPASEFKLDEEKEWDPASLVKDPEPDEVKPWEPILAIVFTCIALSIFNFNRQWLSLQYGYDNGQYIGWWVSQAGQQGTIPLLTEAFFRWLPLINIAWIAEILLNGMLLRSGRWNLSSRLLAIGIKVFQVVILFLLISGASILAITPETLKASGVFDADTAQTLGTMAQTGVRIALGLGIFGSVVEIIKSLYKLFTQRLVATA